MNPIPSTAAPAPAAVQAMVAKLHADYGALTKVVSPLRYSEHLWWDLLSSPEYAYDADRMWADVQHLVRYVQMGIRDGKRNDGALRLINLLQPDTYWEYLALARLRVKPVRPKRPAGESAPAPAAAEAEPTAELLAQRAAELRAFRERGLK